MDTAEERFTRLKHRCKQNGVRYYADKMKKWYRLKPIRTTEEFCESLREYADEVRVGSGVDYFPQDKHGRSTCSYESGNTWTSCSFYIFRGEQKQVL